MDLSKLREYMEGKNAGKSELGMRNVNAFMKVDFTRLKKDKVVPGEASKKIYALQLSIPFDPLTGNTEVFNLDHPFNFPTSPTTAVIYLKQQMRENEGLKEMYAKLGGMTAEEYDVTEDKITEQDEKVFKKYRTVLHYNLPVQKFNMSGFGKYGRKGLSQTKFDKYGRPVEKDLGYQLYELEQALAFEEMAQIKKEYEPGGSKFGKPEKQKKDDFKAVFNRMLVSNPYRAGTVRLLTFELDANDDIKDKDAVKSSTKDNLGQYEKYGSGSKNELSILTELLNTSVDKEFDYLEADVSYPNVTDVPEAERVLTAYQRKAFSKNPVNRIADIDEDFREKYREWRDNQDVFNEEVMMKSVWEYTPIDDNVLLEQYKSDLADKKDLITGAIASNFKGILAEIDEALSDELLDKMLDGEMIEGTSIEGKIEEYSKEIKVPEASEEKPGYGIENVDQAEEMSEEEETELDLLLEG